MSVRCSLLLTLLLSLVVTAASFGSPARGARESIHEPICVDGNLTDLITAIGGNLGAANGGFDLPDVLQEGYTGKCAYENGFDASHYYLFFDFKNPDGTIASQTTLYAGWETAGVIGDVDGDGDPDNIGGPGSNPCALNDDGGPNVPAAPVCSGTPGSQHGIGNGESYTIEFDFGCDRTTDARIVVRQNSVQRVIPSLVDLSAQSAFGIDRTSGGHHLELRVDNLESVFADIPGASLCNARVTLTANSEQDGLGEDRSSVVELSVPPSLRIFKSPVSQGACPGSSVEFTIVVGNDGLCDLGTITVNDILETGLTFVSSVPPPTTSDPQHPQWVFPSLARADSETIVLQALLDEACTGDSLHNHVTVNAVNNVPPGCTGAAGASIDAFAAVACHHPSCSISGPETPACSSIDNIYAVSSPDAGATFLWEITGDGTIVGSKTGTEVHVTAGAGGSFNLRVRVIAAACTSYCDSTFDIGPCAAGICRITGGGCLNETGGKQNHKQNSFGGNVSPAHTGGGPTGNEWEHVIREGNTIAFNFHSHDAHITSCTVVPPGPCSPPAENTRADFEGTGKYSLGAGSREIDANFTAYIIDHGEGKCGGPDFYAITVREGLVQGEGRVVFSISGESDCGNLQIHETPARIFGAQTVEPVEITKKAEAAGMALGDPGVAQFGRAVPNPFSSTMSFSYRVPAGGGQEVEIGTYDMAGRLVRTLASGFQTPGSYTVQWDGRNEAGTRMTPGVYFLHARVAGARQVTRLIYLKP